MDDREDSCSASPPSTLDARIERLFQVSRPPADPERCWRNSEVAAACRDARRDLSESHLSELRRGIKKNPTMRTLDALAWFFDVRTGYFVDDDIATQVEAELIERGRRLDEAVAEAREAQAIERDAARDLQRALRESGVTKTAHRGAGGSARRRADMMRALASALRDEDDDEQRDTSG